MNGETQATDPLLQVYLQEYGKLKDEQIMRIRFRDGMIPLALAAIGALVPFALTKVEYEPALLLVPLICVILGWLYAVNDEKVTQLGEYLRRDFTERLARLLGTAPDAVLLGWEVAHRSDLRRRERKRIQLVVDILAFVAPGVLSSGLFVLLSWQRLGYTALIAVPFALLSIWFLFLIARFSDLTEGK